MALMAPGASMASDVASFIDNARDTLTQDDFLAVPFDMKSEQDKAVFAALTANKEGFQAWRQNIARTHMHMELDDYSALFEQHRSSLLDLAASVDIPVQVNKISFDSLLRKVDAEVSLRERRSPKGAAAFVEARVAVAALHQNAHLFQSRSTLHTLLVQDAVMYGVGEQIGQAFDWVVAKIKDYKCTWCKTVANYIVRSACTAFGNAVCGLLVSAMTGGLGAIASKFFCGFPLYLSSLFTTWCRQGMALLQKKLRVTPDCLCSFSIPSFTIPATDFKVAGLSLFKSTKRVIALGQICPTTVGQCAWSSAQEQKAYDVKKAADDAAAAAAAAAELEKVKKMTNAEKIEYHKAIIAGKLKTALTERMVFDALNSVTHLNSKVTSGAIDGMVDALSDGAQGAGLDALKALGTKTLASTAKSIAAKTVKTVVAGSAGAAATVTADWVAEKTRAGLDKVATKVGTVTGKVTSSVGAKAIEVKYQAMLKSDGKVKADAYKSKALKDLAATAAKVASVTTKAGKIVNKVSTDMLANSAKGYAENESGETLGNKASELTNKALTSKKL